MNIQDVVSLFLTGFVSALCGLFLVSFVVYCVSAVIHIFKNIAG